VSDGLLMCVASITACCRSINALFRTLPDRRLYVMQPRAPACSGDLLSAAWAAPRK
jgi:hypothetical protein